ncbi:MAG TPA: hypothetical protein VEV39_07305 [Gemmatimonadales bacterium]|nr:hypothetical protein [Gemmatimonadales bacterium]
MTTAEEAGDAREATEGYALYYQEGPAAPIPRDRPQFSYRMRVPAGIR